jgi:hypothetical protein
MESEKLQARDHMGRHKHRYKNDIKMDLRQTEYKNINIIHLARDMDTWWALVNTEMNLRI